jgi:hypothetical protein
VWAEELAHSIGCRHCNGQSGAQRKRAIGKE